jgi:hypothetical protein
MVCENLPPAISPTRSKVLPFGCCSGTAGRFEVFSYQPDLGLLGSCEIIDLSVFNWLKPGRFGKKICCS